MKEIKDVFYVGCELETGDIYYFTFTYEKGGLCEKWINNYYNAIPFPTYEVANDVLVKVEQFYHNIEFDGIDKSIETVHMKIRSYFVKKVKLLQLWRETDDC